MIHTVGSVTLPINPKEKVPFAPKAHKIIGQKKEMERIAHAIKLNLPVLIIGETGVGKTSMIRSLAHATNNGFRRLNLNGQTTVDEFVGKLLFKGGRTVWQDGVLIDAMKKGYWLLLDEINAALPEILFVLHSLLDDDRFVVLAEHNGSIIKPHRNFRLFATMNPSGKYAGTKELNTAFISRFPMVLKVDFPKKSEEIAILKAQDANKTIPKEVFEKLVDIAIGLRESYKKGELEFLCSTRDLLSVVRLTQSMPLREAIFLAIENRAGENDERAVSTQVKLYFGSLDKKEEKRSIQTETLIQEGATVKLSPMDYPEMKKMRRSMAEGSILTIPDPLRTDPLRVKGY